MRLLPAFLAALAVGLLTGCPDNDRALFTTPSDFPDKRYAGKTVFIHDETAHRCAEDLRAEIVQIDREMMRRMREASFGRLSTTERMKYVNECREETASLIRELREIIDQNK
jgi:hypothetical protein